MKPVQVVTRPHTKQSFTLLQKSYHFFWAAAAGIVLIVFYVSKPWSLSAGHNTDFAIFYQAALNIRIGLDPYASALSALNSSNSAVAAASYYVYTVPLAIILIPITFLPVKYAAIIWAFLNLVSLCGIVVCLVEAVDKSDEIREDESHLERLFYSLRYKYLVPILIAYFASVGIIRDEIRLGQVDIILTFLSAWSYFLYTRNRYFSAGALLAIATIVKPYYGLILLYYIWKRAYPAIKGFLISSLVAFAASFAVAGYKVNLEWIQVVHLLTAVPHASAGYVVSFQGLLLRTFTTTLPAKPWLNIGTFPATIGAIFLGLIVICGVIVLSRHVNESPLQDDILEYGLWVSAALLVFPSLEDIHVTTALIPLGILILAMPRLVKNKSNHLVIITILILLYFLNPLLPRWQWDWQNGTLQGIHVLETGVYTLGLALLFLVFCFVCRYKLQQH